MIRQFFLLLILAFAGFAQSTPAPPSADDLLKQGRKLNSEGKQDDAIATFNKVAAADPKNWEAQLGVGAALDLKGEYSTARKHIQQAIDMAPADSKSQGMRAMAMSYAFERNTAEAEKYQQQVFDSRARKNDVIGAAEIANELARILLESGDVDGAERWYRRGHETALKKTDLATKDRDLWDFRWEHAQARIAARRGKLDEAKQHVTAAKAQLDKGANPEQTAFFPYLTGYVAYYAGDYKTAASDFLKANQTDPFNLVMIAQAYEKQGDQPHATEYYQKVLASNGHGPTNAYARPLARAKLKAK